MPGTRLSVDLSGSTLRVLEGMPGGPMQCAEAPMPPGSIEGGRVVDAPAIGRALHQMLVGMRVTETRTMVAVNDALASFRVIAFPRGTVDAEVNAAVNGQLAAASDRFASSSVDVPTAADDRTVYSVVWDRDVISGLAEAVKQAGLAPQVAELKSLCLARAVPVASCIVLDLTEDTREVFLIDAHMPRVWHTFAASTETSLVDELVEGMKPVVSYIRRLTTRTFAPDSPIFVRSEPELPMGMLDRLAEICGRPAYRFPQPSRIPANIPHHNFLSCIGLSMRRTS